MARAPRTWTTALPRPRAGGRHDQNAAGTAAVLTLPSTGSDGLAKQKIVISTAVSTTPTVTGITPATGPWGGCTAVTISGRTCRASRRSSSAASRRPFPSLTYNSNGTITIASPLQAAGTVSNVTVTTAAGTSAISSADKFVYSIILPTVTDVLVSSSTWSSGFLNAVDPGRGLGYAIPVGSGVQLAPLPWSDINQIEIQSSAKT